MKNMIKKMEKYLNNESGEITDVGKIVIGCIVLLFILGVAKFVLNWGNEKVENTTKTIDTEYEKWAK